MGLFDIFKKKKTNVKTKESKNLGNLIFKSNKDAFEYTEKFFSSYKIDKKSAYHGIQFIPGAAYIAVEHEGKLVRTMINVKVHPDCKSSINNGDFVLIGVSDLGKRLVTIEELDKITKKKEDTQKLIVEMANMLVREAPTGYILYKLTTELDLKTNQFIKFK